MEKRKKILIGTLIGVAVLLAIIGRYLYYEGYFEPRVEIDLSKSIPLETSPPDVNDPDIIDTKVAFRYLINKSKKYIYIGGLYFTRSMNWRIKRDLKRAIKRGVKVKFLFDDSHFARREFYNSDFYQMKGVEVRFADISKLGISKWGRYHAKYAIFDGKWAIVGSANFSYPAFNNNIEINVLVVEPEIVKKLVEVFEKDWEIATKPPVKQKFFASFPLTQEQIKKLYPSGFKFKPPIMLLESAPYEINSPDIPDIKDAIKFMLINVTNEALLEIYAFTITPERLSDIYNLLLNAKKRGVDIKILISQSTLDKKNEEGKYVYTHVRNAVRNLIENGIEVKKFKIWEATGTEFSAVHSKLFIIDDYMALITTGNWAKTSIFENREFGIITTKTDIVYPLHRKFYRDWSSKFAVKVTDLLQ